MCAPAIAVAVPAWLQVGRQLQEAAGSELTARKSQLGECCWYGRGGDRPNFCLILSGAVYCLRLCCIVMCVDAGPLVAFLTAALLLL